MHCCCGHIASIHRHFYLEVISGIYLKCYEYRFIDGHNRLNTRIHSCWVHMSPLTEKQLHLLAFLVPLHDQEVGGCEALHTQSGRTLYFELAKTMLGDPSHQSAGLKQRLGRLSERTIRNRMRAFEQMGLMKVHSRAADARTRELVTTEKFEQELKLHLDKCGLILEKHFYVIGKQRKER